MFGFPEIVPKKSFFFAPFGRLEKQNPTKFSSRGSFTAYHHKNNSLLQSELRMSMLFLEVLLAISESESLIIPSDTSDSEFSASFSSESDSSSESTVIGSTPSPSNRISESRLPLSGREIGKSRSGKRTPYKIRVFHEFDPTFTDPFRCQNADSRGFYPHEFGALMSCNF